jgi:hypothetical protein
MIENFEDRSIINFRVAEYVNKDALSNQAAQFSFLTEEYENKYMANNL